MLDAGYVGLLKRLFSARRIKWFSLYFLVVLLAKLFLRSFWRRPTWGLLTFLVGGAFGIIWSIVDRLIYVYYSRPDDELSLDVKRLVANKSYDQALTLLWSRQKEQTHLAMNNVLFMAVWIVLAMFLVTSSGSEFARGLILGIGLDILWGLYREWKNPELLKERLFWPVKRDVTDQELKVAAGTFVGFFALATLLSI